MKYKRWWLIIVAAAAAAGATTFVSEDFEGSFPPAGWHVAGNGYGSGGWSKTAGPYWGDCAYGYARAASGSSSYYYRSQLLTSTFIVPTERSIYYRFDYRAAYGGSAGAIYCFFIFDGMQEYIITVPQAEWRTFAGSRILAADTYCCRLEIVAAGTQNQYGYFYVDNLWVADEPFTAVAPASLGRVKALFR